MLLLVVWIAVPVLCLVVLAAVGYGLFGALQRLGREAQALEREVAPLLASAQALQARAATAAGERPTNPAALPGPGASAA
ncbi:hypothetical protein [Blastococcus sp. SYSU D00695]